MYNKYVYKISLEYTTYVDERGKKWEIPVLFLPIRID